MINFCSLIELIFNFEIIHLVLRNFQNIAESYHFISFQ